MDIEVVIKKTLVFAGLAGSVVAVVSVVAFVSQDLLASVVAVPRWVSNMLAAAIIAGLYGPLRNWLVNTTEQYLFQKKYDYKALLKQFTDQVMTTVDLKQLLEMTVKTLTDVVKLDGCSLLLLNKDSRKYELVASRGANRQQVVLEEHEPFITFFRETHEPIGQDGELGKVKFPPEVTNRVKQLGARLCLPLQVHEELIGVLSLGKKKSDEEFGKDDLDILLPLARTLAIAIANAQLITQRLQFLTEIRKGDQLKAVATLAAGMAHEIKNPLTAIKTFAAYLPEKAHDPAFQQQFQRIVAQEVEKIDQIVRRLLDFAKPAPPHLTPTPVGRLLDETLDFLSGECLKRRVQVHRTYTAEADTIQADPQQLRQVFLNLLLNSLEAMEESGTLSVAIAAQGSHLTLTIQDTGHGIPPDHLERVFDPFFTTKPQGTGLGLSIVQNILTEHHATIAIESSPPRGTRCTLTFPRASQAG